MTSVGILILEETFPPLVLSCDTGDDFADEVDDEGLELVPLVTWE